MPSADRAAICGFVCGAWGILLDASEDLASAVAVLEGVLASEGGHQEQQMRQQQDQAQQPDAGCAPGPQQPKRPKSVGAGAAGVAAPGASGVEATLWLPREGSALVSLLAYARALRAGSGPAAHGSLAEAAAAGGGGGSARKRHRQSTATAAPCWDATFAGLQILIEEHGEGGRERERRQSCSRCLLTGDAAAASAASARLLSKCSASGSQGATAQAQARALFALRAHCLAPSDAEPLLLPHLPCNGGAADALLLLRCAFCARQARPAAADGDLASVVDGLTDPHARVLAARAACCAAERAAASAAAGGSADLTDLAANRAAVHLAFQVVDRLVLGTRAPQQHLDWRAAAAALSQLLSLHSGACDGREAIHGGPAKQEAVRRTFQLVQRVLVAANAAQGDAIGSHGRAGGACGVAHVSSSGARRDALAACRQHVGAAVAAIERQLQQAPAAAGGGTAAAGLGLLPFAPRGSALRVAARLSEVLGLLEEGQPPRRKQQREEQQGGRPAEAAAGGLPAWLEDAAVAVASVVLRGDAYGALLPDALSLPGTNREREQLQVQEQEQQQEQELEQQQDQECEGPAARRLFKAVEHLFLSRPRPSPALAACLAAALRPAGAAALAAGAGEALVDACLSPLTEETALLLERLVLVSPRHRHAFVRRLGPHVAAIAEAEGPAARRGVLALALPAALAALRLGCSGRGGDAAADGGAAGPGGQAPQLAVQLGSDSAAVAAVYREPLLAYMCSKRRQQQRRQSDEHLLPAGALEALRRHAVPVLLLCLASAQGGGGGGGGGGPTQQARQLLDLLPRVLAPAGWDPGMGQGIEGAAGGGSDAVATTRERAQLASWIVLRRLEEIERVQEQQRQRQAQDQQGGNGDEGGSRLLQERVELLGSYLEAACATLAACYKLRSDRADGRNEQRGTWHEQQQQQQQKKKKNQQQQQQQQQQQLSNAGPYDLESHLLLDLDTWLGDQIADLPDSARAGPAFGRILTATRRLAVATLRRRLRDAGAVRSLRRLLAALLPSGEVEEMDGNGSRSDDFGSEGEQGELAKGPGEGDGASSMDFDSSEQEGSGHSSDTEHRHMEGAGGGGDAGGPGSSSGGGSGSVSSDGDDSDGDIGSQVSSLESGGDGRDERGRTPVGSGEEFSDGAEDGRGGPMEGEEGGKEGEEGGDASDDADLDGGSDDEEMQNGVSSETGPGDVAYPEALPYVDNPEAAALARQLLELLVAHSNFVPAMAPPGGSGGGGATGAAAAAAGSEPGGHPAPLPASVARLATPLGSLAPVIDALLAEAGAAERGSSGGGSSGGGSGGGSGAGGSQKGKEGPLELKQELAVLLEVLLDMQLQFTPPGEDGDGGDSGGGSEDEDNTTASGSGGEGSPEQQRRRRWRRGAAGAAGLLRPLLRLLLAGYHGTMHPADQAVLRAVLRIDHLLAPEGAPGGPPAAPWRPHEPPAGAAAATALLRGATAAETGLLYGEAARALLVARRPAAAPAAPRGVGGGGGCGADPALRGKLLREKFAPCPLRCALTVVLFPDDRPLSGYAAADEDGGGSGGEGPSWAAGVPPECAAAAYDPCSLLPLAAASLADGAMDAAGFAGCGLLGVCLRALAAKDPGIRALAYECLALFGAALGAAAAPPTPAAAPPTLAAAPRLRDAQQLEALLSFVRNGVSAPLQRLPASAAAFAAEASLLLRAPGAAGHGYVQRMLLRAPAAEYSRLMWAMSLLAAGRQDHRADRQWLLRLIWLGLRGPEDAHLYRRQYVWEQLAAQYGSPSSESASLDPLIAHVTWQAARIPAAASHLVRSSGLLPFLAAAASRAASGAGDSAGAGAAAAAQGGRGRGGLGVGGGEAWPMDCLNGLLSHRIGLVQRESSAPVYEGYINAVREAARVAPPRAALRALCLLASAAPGVRELRRMQQALLGPSQACALVAALQQEQQQQQDHNIGSRSNGSGIIIIISSSSRGPAPEERQLLALLLHLPPPRAREDPGRPAEAAQLDRRRAWSLAGWAARAVLRVGPTEPLTIDGAIAADKRRLGGGGGGGGGASAFCAGERPSAGVQLIMWLDRLSAQQLADESPEAVSGGPAAGGFERQLHPEEAAGIGLDAYSAYVRLEAPGDMLTCRAPLLRLLAALAREAGRRELVGEGGGPGGGADAAGATDAHQWDLAAASALQQLLELD